MTCYAACDFRQNSLRRTVATDHAVSLSAVLQLGTLYQQPLTTCLHRHLISAAVSRLNYLPGLIALTQCNTVVTLDSSMTLDTQVTATVRACNFYLQALRQLYGTLCLVMLHRASLVPSLIRGWITATLGMSNTIFQRLQRAQNAAARLFAKLHDANITQSTFLRISIGYLCVAESTNYEIYIYQSLL